MRTVEYFNRRLGAGYKRLDAGPGKKPSSRKYFEIKRIISECQANDDRLYEMVSSELNIQLDSIRQMPIKDFLIKFDSMISNILTRREQNMKAKQKSSKRSRHGNN